MIQEPRSLKPSKGLFTNYERGVGGLQNGSGAGGHVTFYPYEKGRGGRKSFRPAIFPFCSPPSP